MKGAVLDTIVVIVVFIIGAVLYITCWLPKLNRQWDRDFEEMMRKQREHDDWMFNSGVRFGRYLDKRDLK